MHRILGISDKRSKEISKEVVDALTTTGMVDAGTTLLMEKYDPESLLVGMRLYQLMDLSRELSGMKKLRVAARVQNAVMN